MNQLARLLGSWRARVAVHGHSMAPTLLEGDWLLVDPGAYRTHPPSSGELVLADTPDGPVVKRVEGTSEGSQLLLGGDAPSVAHHRHDLVVPASAVSGRPWFRYWPPGRIGPLR